MKSLLLPGTILGAAALEGVAQIGDDKWVQMVRDVGFPILAAIALSLVVRSLGNKLLGVYEKVIDESRKREDRREEEDRRREQENQRHHRQMRKYASAEILLLKEIVVQLKDVGIRVSHQTNVVRSEAAHTAEVLVKADEDRGKKAS